MCLCVEAAKAGGYPDDLDLCAAELLSMLDELYEDVDVTYAKEGDAFQLVVFPSADSSTFRTDEGWAFVVMRNEYIRIYCVENLTMLSGTNVHEMELNAAVIGGRLVSRRPSDSLLADDGTESAE